MLGTYLIFVLDNRYNNIDGQKANCRNPQKHNFTIDTLNVLFTYIIIFDRTR